MKRFVLVWIVCVGLGAMVVAHAQTPVLTLDTAAPSSAQLLGAHFSPVPEVLYAQVPVLPRNQGLVVESIKKKSVAEKMGLRRHDVVLSFGNTPILDVNHLAGLLWATPPGQTAKFGILRSGKSMSVTYTFQAADLPAIPKSLIKPSGPPAVNVEVDRLGDDRMKIIFSYYAGGSSKLQTFTCIGTVEEIETQLAQMNQKQQIPGQVQDLLDIAVQRLRNPKTP